MVSDRAREGRITPRLSLNQLRIFFFVTGCVVVGAVLSLSYVIHKKMAEAARDREEMIASRVFDELEREISAFLDGENARAHYQDLNQTDPELWAPFVVGYFRDDQAFERSTTQKQLVAADGATSENKRRIAWAIEGLNERLKREQVALPPSNNGRLTQVAADEGPTVRAIVAPENTEKEKRPSVVPQGTAPGSKIIESLNRAPERRKQQQATPSRPTAPKSTDPFNDYAERY